MGANALLDLVREGPLLSVGVLTADLGHLADELALLEAGGARLVHIDVMDGVFCPMMTVGPPFVKALRTPLLKDVHLMIDDPLEQGGVRSWPPAPTWSRSISRARRSRTASSTCWAGP